MVPTQNLANFQLQLHRMGGGDWSDIDGTDLLASFKTDPTWSKVISTFLFFSRHILLILMSFFFHTYILLIYTKKTSAHI